jgi:hypothetical protein
MIFESEPFSSSLTNQQELYCAFINACLNMFIQNLNIETANSNYFFLTPKISSPFW